MVHFAEINQSSQPYSMLQHIGRVATPKLVPRNCPRYLQTTLIMGGGGLVLESMGGILEFPEKKYFCTFTLVQKWQNKINKARIRALKIFKMLYTGRSTKEAMSLLLSEST